MKRLICAGLLLCIGFLIRPVLARSSQASIVIRTDGTTATVETFGGDVGYPGPSQVVIERDALGIVVVSRVRLFVPLDERVYASWVQK